MSTTWYKATRPDATTRGGVRWVVGETTRHPVSTAMVDADRYVCASSRPAETLRGGSIPCRLFEVEPAGEMIGSAKCPHRRCALAWRVLREVEPWRALGPQGRRAAALVERLRVTTADETERLAAPRVGWSTWSAAWPAVWVAWDARAAATNGRTER